MANRGGGFEFETPPAVNRGRSDGGGADKKKIQWCGKGWQLTAIFWTVLIGVTAFVALEIAIVSKSDDLDQTSRATVSMHDETIELRRNIEDYIKGIRQHFPANQETLTAEQVFDSIDKAHAMMLWLNELRAGMPPEAGPIFAVPRCRLTCPAPQVIQQLVKNANTLVGNVSSVVGTVKGLFDGLGTDNNERHRTMVNNAAMFFAKGAELLSTVSPGEFHTAFAATNEAVQVRVPLFVRWGLTKLLP